MAYDAGMLAAVVHEIDRLLNGGKVMKVQQPEKDEIVLQIHSNRENYRLSLSASSANPKINITDTNKENPLSAPMFCMLLRKHLVGSILRGVRQVGGFERVLELEFDTRDELGFDERKFLVTEITGKFTNIIFCDSDRKITSALRTTDLTVSNNRPILPGIVYENLPRQVGKRDPLTETREGFLEIYTEDLPVDKLIAQNYAGFSALVNREIAHRARKSGGGREDVWAAFEWVVTCVREKRFTPTLVTDESGVPIEFCYIPITQYGNGANVCELESFGRLIDRYYGERDRADRMRQRSADITKVLNNATARIRKKTALQLADIESCKQKDDWKSYGDLITANIWQLKRGMREATVTDYMTDPPREVKIKLDGRHTPAQNAQSYFKKYNKAKITERELAKQIEKSKAELEYLDTVADALTRAESEQDLSDIRAELGEMGYISHGGRANQASQQKKQSPKPMEFTSVEGHKILCGKNNRQNDYISHRIAEPTDWWFHVKNAPGSHVILRCDGDTPTDAELTQACEIAAYYSSRQSDGQVAVDYTMAKNLKKPAGSAPGFVTYKTNQTAFVAPKITVSQ